MNKKRNALKKKTQPKPAGESHQVVSKEKFGLMKVGIIVGIAGSIATILALFFSLYQNNNSVDEKAPLFSLKQVDINELQNDSSKVTVTLVNEGQRTAHFKYAYNYVFNTLTKTARSFPIFTTAEINPNNQIILSFAQTRAVTIDPNTYYCTKIWFHDKRDASIETKEMFYKLGVVSNQVYSSSIPNDILKVFKAQIEAYEKSSLFRNSDIAINTKISNRRTGAITSFP